MAMSRERQSATGMKRTNQGIVSDGGNRKKSSAAGSGSKANSMRWHAMTSITRPSLRMGSKRHRLMALSAALSKTPDG